MGQYSGGQQWDNIVVDNSGQNIDGQQWTIYWWTTLGQYSVGQQWDNIEGSRPEWCISSMIYSRDTPFWSGTLNIVVDNSRTV